LLTATRRRRPVGRSAHVLAWAAGSRCLCLLLEASRCDGLAYNRRWRRQDALGGRSDGRRRFEWLSLVIAIEPPGDNNESSEEPEVCARRGDGDTELDLDEMRHHSRYERNQHHVELRLPVIHEDAGDDQIDPEHDDAKQGRPGREFDRQDVAINHKQSNHTAQEQCDIERATVPVVNHT
jgi:hypothetical protein